MKLVVYTLNSDGTIPDYIVDGGYLDIDNGGSWPQHIDLVGIALDSAPQLGFANMDSLLTYVQEKNFTFKDSITEKNISPETIVSIIWSKLN
jgi:hypothetical protein